MSLQRGSLLGVGAFFVAFARASDAAAAAADAPERFATTRSRE